MKDEKTITHSEFSENSKEKLPLEEQIEILQKKLEDAEMRATEKGIALIEMTAGRNALYQSLQDTQMRLAEVTGQYENDVQVYKNELEVCMKEKRQLQEQYDSIFIKAKRYDELQESVIKIKMKAEMQAHEMIDDAQEKAMDAVNLIDDIEKEMRLFRDDITFLRRDIKIGTITLDDRLENVDARLTKSLGKLLAIKETFYINNSLPLDNPPDVNDQLIFDESDAGTGKGDAPFISYPEVINPPYPPKQEGGDDQGYY